MFGWGKKKEDKEVSCDQVARRGRLKAIQQEDIVYGSSAESRLETTLLLRGQCIAEGKDPSEYGLGE